ncbi:unnamed protein product [Ilex paraguariensis]|uniref:Dual specificity phosphatase catalytic domain-containing protein n=1 Tax=Ilex paraguariensis TaxID=185542 RepID=A0ABC8RYG9_9AQUA
MGIDLNDERSNEFIVKFRELFGVVNDAYVSRNTHCSWIDVNYEMGCTEEKGGINEPGTQIAVLFQNGIRSLGWSFGSTESIVLGSALIPFGLIYPKIGTPFNVVKGNNLNKSISAQLSLEISDVSGKSLECKCCDLQLLNPMLSKLTSDNTVNALSFKDSETEGSNNNESFWCHLGDGPVKLHVNAVQRYAMSEKIKGCSIGHILVRGCSGQPGKSRKKCSKEFFADRALKMLLSGMGEFILRNSIPIWQILPSVLYMEGYWALVSLSNSKGDRFSSILKPLIAHLALRSIIDNGLFTINNFIGSNLANIDVEIYKTSVDKTNSDSCTGSQTDTSPSGKCVQLGDGKRKTNKKHLHQNLKWSSFREEGAASVSCLEAAESFFNNLPMKIQQSHESGLDLQTLSERLVNSSIHWLSQQHEIDNNVEGQTTMVKLDDTYNKVVGAKLVKLLLRDPKELKEKRNDNLPSFEASDPSSRSENMVREYPFCKQCEKDKACVLVRYMSGKNRSPTIVIAYLMKSKGWRLAQSYQWVKERRCSVDLTQALCSFIYLRWIATPSTTRKNGRRLPPGPRGLPIIGNLHMLGNLPHHSLHEMTKKYGPIMSLRLGRVPTIVVSSPAAAEIFLKTHDILFASRPKVQAAEVLFYGSKGVGFTQYGPYWRNVRKFCTLELLSATKIESLAGMRREELGLLVESLKAAAAAREVVDVSEKVGGLIEDMTYRMLFGRSKDDRFDLKAAIEEALELIGAFNLSDYVPILKPLDLQNNLTHPILDRFTHFFAMGFNQRFKAISKVLDQIMEVILNEHEQDASRGFQSRDKDFVDVMLSLMNKEKRLSWDAFGVNQHKIGGGSVSALLQLGVT